MACEHVLKDSRLTSCSPRQTKIYKQVPAKITAYYICYIFDVMPRPYVQALAWELFSLTDWRRLETIVYPINRLLF